MDIQPYDIDRDWQGIVDGLFGRFARRGSRRLKVTVVKTGVTRDYVITPAKDDSRDGWERFWVRVAKPGEKPTYLGLLRVLESPSPSGKVSDFIPTPATTAVIKATPEYKAFPVIMRGLFEVHEMPQVNLTIH